jgi:hypothetical protein
MSDREKAQARENISVKSAGQLKEYLLASNRKYVVFKTDDLIDSLPWPDGVNFFIQCVTAYRDQRLTIESGRVDAEGNPIYKSDDLEKDELIEAVSWLREQID